MEDVTETLAGIRLSPQQRRLWLLQELQQIPLAKALLRLDGALDRPALRAAVAGLVARHDILRTRFETQPGMKLPVQGILATGAPAWSAEDLSALSAVEQEARIAACLRPAGASAAELAAGAGLGVQLLRLAPDRHALVLTLPALCADAPTFANLGRELAQGYEAADPGEAGDEAMQYWQYSEWLNDLLAEDSAAEGRAHWGEPASTRPAPRLAFAAPRQIAASEETFAPETIPSALDAAQLAGLRTVAEAHGVSLAAFLLAAWRVLLLRLSGESVAVGVTLDGREFEELAGACGPFTRALPVRSRLASQNRFSAVLRETGEESNELAEWQRYFVWEPSRAALLDREIPPFFPFGFELQEEAAPVTGGGVAFALDRVAAETEPFHLKLTCRERGGNLDISLRFDPRSYSAAEARFCAAAWAALLTSAGKHPERSLQELDLLPAAERERILTAASGKRVAVDTHLLAHQLFELQVERTPEAPALLFGPVARSYRETNTLANRLAWRLRALGVGPESPVGLCLESGPEAIVALLAILKAGGAFVPLDPHGPAERRAFLLADARIGVLLTQSALAAELASFPGEILAVDAPLAPLAPDAAGRDRESGDNPPPRALPENLAYVIYTSGSTGTPKGVGVTHRNLVHYLAFVERELFAGRVRRCPLLTALTFDACLKQVLTPLLCGEAVWGLPSGAAPDPTLLLAGLAGEQSLAINGTPSLWRAILETIDRPRAAGDLAGLRALFLGGERLSQDLLEATAALLPEVEIWNLYGPTETTANAAVARLEAGRPVTLGRPLPNTRIDLLDRGGLVPFGAPGELHISGPGVARGYLHRPELTAERFLPDPCAGIPGERAYRTGDLGRLTPEGEIEYLGRTDHQVKVRGFRIELGEIESRLELLPAVREAAVTLSAEGAPDPRLVAYVVPAAGQELRVDDLKGALRAMLPEYMIPAAFVVLPRMPLLSSGKVDRAALPSPAAAGEARAPFVAPSTPVERRLAEIWAEVLKRQGLGVHDNFFELGGHSIQSIQITHRATESGLPLTPRDLLERPTIAELAALFGAVEIAAGIAAPTPGPAESGEWEEGQL